jgi:Ca2+-binding EF-hand superfamily protein
MPALNDMQLAALRKAFDTCDRSGNGFIDCNEFLQLLRVLDHDTSEDEALLAFESVDTEGDGYIGFKEFVAWWIG